MPVVAEFLQFFRHYSVLQRLWIFGSHTAIALEHSLITFGNKLLKITQANLQGAAIAESRLDGLTINGILVTDLLAAYQASRPALPAE